LRADEQHLLGGVAQSMRVLQVLRDQVVNDQLWS
jgi:hypothetical protein